MSEILNRQEVKKLLSDELKGLCDRIKINHITAGQTASGKTAKSIQYSVTETNGGGFRGLIVGRRAFGTLETGARAGKRFKGFRFVIYDWMKAKGIRANHIPYVRKPSDKWKPKYTAQQRGDMSLAYAIAKSIEKKGTRLYREGGRDDIYSNEIPVTIENISKQINAMFQKSVQTINLNTRV